ncbi:MAG: hypothetical protein ACYC2H_00295 [Thermoplasmatota archaeon]
MGVATLVALGIALVILILVVLPVAYGKDPTRFGQLTGIDRFYDQPQAAGPGVVTPVNTTGSSLSVFNVTWAPREFVLGASDGQLGPGEGTEVRMDVFEDNVTRLTAVLSWTDDEVAGQPTAPDVFELNITSPSGETRTFLGRNQGLNGTLTAAFVIGGTPPDATVTAVDHKQALEAAHALEAARKDARGTWTFTVRLMHAGGFGPLSTGDSGNAWSLQASVQIFTPALGNPQVSAIRQDTLNLTIPARGQIEFKAAMSEGANLTYDWTATGELNYEFHGDSGDLFQSHGRGTSDRASGDFTAPFTGRHGWYWQNPGATDVQVTLKLRGEYVIVGIV